MKVARKKKKSRRREDLDGQVHIAHTHMALVPVQSMPFDGHLETAQIHITAPDFRGPSDLAIHRGCLSLTPIDPGVVLHRRGQVRLGA